MIEKIATMVDFNSKILQNEHSTLVMFSSETCTPCKMMLPIVANLSKDYPVYKVDVYQNQDIAIKYSISAVPTFIIFRNGVVVDIIKGICSEQQLRTLLEKP